MNTEPIIIERTFHVPIEKIWNALTNANEMKLWYFDMPEFKPEIGFEFQFIGCKDENTEYLHLCKVMEVIPGKKLKHSWRYDGYEGDSYVTFELIAEGSNTTKLILTHEGLETFPASNPDFERHWFLEGWGSILDEALKGYLKK